MLFSILLIVHIVVAAVLIVLVLLQQGKGADMGTGFGGGSSGTVFGASGAGNFLSKFTTWLGVGFFASSLTLAMLASQQSSKPAGVVLDDVPAEQVETPAGPAQSQGDLPAPPPQN